MIRDIITYPNKLLRTRSQDVVSFDATLHQLLDDMYDTMIAKEGVGLAAIQVGVALNALLICVPDENNVQSHDNLLEAINPRIVYEEGSIKYDEGCLSVPGVYETVKRSRVIDVQYQDRYGVHHTLRAEEFSAVVWQHEMDHLLGHLFIEKLSLIKRKRFEKEWKKKLKG